MWKTARFPAQIYVVPGLTATIRRRKGFCGPTARGRHPSISLATPPHAAQPDFPETLAFLTQLLRQAHPILPSPAERPHAVPSPGGRRGNMQQDALR